VKLVIMGIFLAVEGPEGVGKTTLVSVLRERMAGVDHVTFTRDPALGPGIDQEPPLLGADLARARAEDRAAHVARVIRPALDAGTAVVCDGYVLSSLVFHSADGVPPGEIWRLNQSLPMPDVNLVLTAPAKVISGRRARRPSLPRCEAGGDPAAELTRYLRFGQEMRARGVPLMISPHETPEQFERAVEWATLSIRNGI
jgi:dTMP kinase